MKNIYPFLIACATLTFGCSDNETNTSDAPIGEDYVDRVETTTTEDGKVSMTGSAAADLQDLLDDFQSCRDASTSRNDCRHWISKLVCEFNGIDDFKVDGEYVIYDSIRPIIEISSVWSKLGSGADASVLSKAQENANNGVPTVAIDVSQSYGLVVLILPGEAKKASKWDGNLVPNAACFTHVKSSTPFINKSVAYAFRTSENIVFYSR